MKIYDLARSTTATMQTFKRNENNPAQYCIDDYAKWCAVNDGIGRARRHTNEVNNANTLMQIEETKITIDFWWVQSQMCRSLKPLLLAIPTKQPEEREKIADIQVSIRFESLKLNEWPSGMFECYNSIRKSTTIYWIFSLLVQQSIIVVSLSTMKLKAKEQ